VRLSSGVCDSLPSQALIWEANLVPVAVPQPGVQVYGGLPTPVGLAGSAGGTGYAFLIRPLNTSNPPTQVAMVLSGINATYMGQSLNICLRARSRASARWEGPRSAVAPALCVDRRRRTMLAIRRSGRRARLGTRRTRRTAMAAERLLQEDVAVGEAIVRVLEAAGIDHVSACPAATPAGPSSARSTTTRPHPHGPGSARRAGDRDG
jgi:hypothetical protein